MSVRKEPLRDTLKLDIAGDDSFWRVAQVVRFGRIASAAHGCQGGRDSGRWLEFPFDSATLRSRLRLPLHKSIALSHPQPRRADECLHP